MRLEAYFHQTPDGKPVPPGTIYRIRGFARVDRYTLVMWRMGGEEEYSTGETLYDGRRRIASDNGQLSLYTPVQPPAQSVTPVQQTTVWDRVDKRVGMYGLPPAIATALRHPRNTVYFEF